MKRFLLILAALCSSLYAQTAINDTLYLQSATPWTGQITITWPAFTTASGTPVAAGRRVYAVNSGVVAITLWPTLNASPSVAYAATYRTAVGEDRGKAWDETWVIPETPSIVTLADVRKTSSLFATNSGGAVSSVAGRQGDIVLAQSDITGLVSALASKADSSALSGKADASALTAHTTNTSNPHSVTAAQVGAAPTSRTVNGHALSADVTVTKGDVGLGNVDNTADSAKPISTATQAALDGKAGRDNPVFTGRVQIGATACPVDAPAGSACLDGNIYVGAGGGSPGVDSYDGSRHFDFPSVMEGSYTILLAGLAASTDLADTANLPTKNGTNVYTGAQDASGSTHTIPAKTGLVANKPATCTVGEEYFASDSTAGQNKWYCTAANTWTQQVGPTASGGMLLAGAFAPTGLATIPLNTTVGYMPGSNSQNASYGTSSLWPTPVAGTLKNLYISTRTIANGGAAQPSDGALTCTIYKNGSATSLLVSFAAGYANTTSPASDTTHTVSLAVGDQIHMRCTNASTTAASIGLVGWSMVLQ